MASLRARLTGPSCCKRQPRGQAVDVSISLDEHCLAIALRFLAEPVWPRLSRVEGNSRLSSMESPRLAIDDTNFENAASRSSRTASIMARVSAA
jgi:hypothetical protein